MIATDLAHITGQIAMTPALQKGLDFLNTHGGRELAAGRIAIDGDRVLASIQLYATIVTDTPKVEAHRRYIDLQFIASGEEAIGWAPLERLAITQPYDEAKDNCFGTVISGDLTRIHLRAGQLAVFYPEDAHAPKLAVGPSVPVTKIVVKVAV
jgi:biofilm protein TabA